MERFTTLFIASLCAAPLFYFLFSAAVVGLSDPSGPDARLGVAYLATWGGFLAAFTSFFLTWFLINRFLAGPYLHFIQLFDGLALIGWFVVYMIWSDDQPYRLNYPDHRAVLAVEVRMTKPYLNGQSIDSILEFQYIGQDFDTQHPDPIREEGNFVILPWETTPFEVNKWKMRVFVRNKPVDFMLNLPRRPLESTNWSSWEAPRVEQQQEPLPDGVLQNMTLRYCFRLEPYGAP